MNYTDPVKERDSVVSQLLELCVQSLCNNISKVQYTLIRHAKHTC